MTDDDGRPATPSPVHLVGQPLDTLSLAELNERIVLLREEVSRLERAVAAKQGALGAAMALFSEPPTG